MMKANSKTINYVGNRCHCEGPMFGN